MHRWIRIQNRWNWRSQRRLKRSQRHSWRMSSLKSQSQSRSCHHQKIIKRKKCRINQRSHRQKTWKIRFRYRHGNLCHRPPSHRRMSWFLRLTLLRKCLIRLNHQTHQQNVDQCRLIRKSPSYGPNPLRFSLSRQLRKRCHCWYRIT